MTDLRRHVPGIALSWDDEAPSVTWRIVDGTLVYADISGFTALTERLSRRGRIGAEEIVEVLNRLFGTMLHTATARGADLLKFGGDALVFLVRGDDHAQRACDAAVEMRRALRGAAEIPTSVGRLRLSMSVGIHSGPVLLIMTGSPSRELFILGHAARETVAAERAAGPGQIVVSAQTANALPRNATRPRDDGVLLLRQRTARAISDATSSNANGSAFGADRLRSVFPPALGDYLGPAVPDPEHRMATIAFVRFAGTDEILADRGPESLADAVTVTLSTVQEMLAAEGVTLLSTDLGHDGGTFFLASGVPHASEDDEARMLRALHRIVTAGTPIPLQAGVNRGHVFAAEVGTAQRAAYSAMGDTTNTAARIAARAPVGHVYAHPAVLQHSRTLFASTPVGPFAMKGKAAPLTVYDVGEEQGQRIADGPAHLPMMGREAELAGVQAILDAAASGTGGVVTVSGATGIGKSRLIREALAARDVGSPARSGDAAAGPAAEGSDPPAATRAVSHLLTVRAEPYGAATAYRVFRDPVRALLGIDRGTPDQMGERLLDTLTRSAPHLRDMAPLLADVVSVLVPPTPQADAVDPQFRPDRLADLMVDLLDALLPGSLVLVAEEAHWADHASAHLLHRVAAATVTRPWALVVARRGEESGFVPGTGERITLDPLPDHVIARLVTEATQDTPLLPHETDAIVARAAGNPLYVSEILRATRAGGSPDTMPDSLGAAMAAQIDALNPDARRVLRHAAVLGRSFRPEILQLVLEAEGVSDDGLPITGSSAGGVAGGTVPGLPAELDELLVADGSGRMRFRVGMVRDAAYDGMAYRMRARIHRAAGLAIERLSTDPDADAATLALHFSRAGDAERTWRYAMRAGDVARRAYANADAAEHYAMALEFARRLDIRADERIAAWSALGEVRELAGVLDGSIDAYRRAASLAVADPGRGAELLARRARVLERAGSYVAALRAITRARRLVEAAAQSGDVAGAERTRAHLDLLTALVRLGQERPAPARVMAQRAADGARRSGDAQMLVQGLMAIDAAEQYLGISSDMTFTREALDACVEHGFRPQESIARANLGTHAYEAGRWDEAVEWYESARRVALEAGNAFGAAETEVNLGDLLVSRGALDEAEPMLRSAIGVLRASGMGFEATYGDMQRARIDLARGRLDDAAERIAAVVAEFGELGHPMTTAEAELVAADVANAAGRPDDALAHVDRAVAAMGGDLGPFAARAELQRARALLRLKRHGEAAAAIDAGLIAAESLEQPCERARLLATRADPVTAAAAGALDAPDGLDPVVDECASTALLRGLGAAALPDYLR